MPIISLLSSKIKLTFRTVVIEITHCNMTFLIQAYIKRDVLIQTLCLFRVISHGIPRCQTKAFFCLIQMSGLFSKAEEMVGIFNLRSMHAAKISILTICQIRYIRMKYIALFIQNTDDERLFLNQNIKFFSCDKISILFRRKF